MYHLVANRDLAKLYQCKNGTKSINLAVSRNINKFPNDFYFKLTDKEIYNVSSRFQNGTLNENKRGNSIKYNPCIFIEEGVNIMRTFAMMRKYISNNLIEQKYINNQVLKNTEDIKLLQESFTKFDEKLVKYILMVKYMMHTQG